jgi:hypothetical protein
MHREYPYTIVRRDHLTPGYGYVASNHSSLAHAQKALTKAHYDSRHVILYTGGWRPRGSTLAIQERNISASKEDLC